MEIEEIQKIVEGSFVLREKPIAKRRPCRFLLDGSPIQLESKKAVWNQPGHAKAALTNHVSNLFQTNKELRSLGWLEQKALQKAVVHGLMKSGRLVLEFLGDCRAV